MFLMFFALLAMAQPGFAGDKAMPEAASACPLKSKGCENPFTADAHCGALTLKNFKVVQNTNATERAR